MIRPCTAAIEAAARLAESLLLDAQHIVVRMTCYLLGTYCLW